jgi:hypothetical protein
MLSTLLAAAALFSEQTGPIAASAGAEIYEITIKRCKASYAARDADVTNLTLALHFPAKWKSQRHSYLVRIVSLEPIADDTGKILSTKGRLRKIKFLGGDVLVNGSFDSRALEGPVIRMVMDVPARRAIYLKSVKGKAKVSRVRIQFVEFPFAAVLGKPLEHPLVKGFKLIPKMEMENGDTTVRLRASNLPDRLVKWGLTAGDRELECVRYGDSFRTYRGQLPEGCSLWLMFDVPAETKTFEFDFKNVELP